MSGTIALFCLLTIGFVFSRRHGSGYDHHDDDGYDHSDDYGHRGHRFAHSSYGYYRDGPTYRKLKQESRYNDFEGSEYYLKKVYGDEDDHTYGDEHHEETKETKKEEVKEYEQTQPTYSKAVVDPAAPVVDPAAAVDGTVVVDAVTVVAPAVVAPAVVAPAVVAPSVVAPAVVDPVVAPALPDVVDNTPVVVQQVDAATDAATSDVTTPDVATPDAVASDPAAVVPDAPAAPFVVVVVVDAATDIPAIVDNLAQLIQKSDAANVVTAQQVEETPVVEVPTVALAIAVPTITLPADHVVTDTLVSRDLVPAEVTTPEVVPQTVPTTIAVKTQEKVSQIKANKDKMKAFIRMSKQAKGHH